MSQENLIGGIYEACIGTQAPIPFIQYWEHFGYRIGKLGELSAAAANQLYGVNSPLRSIRLYHQDSDRGLIRLMVWDHPINQGLGMSSMKVKGNRWTTTLTADMLNILNHAEEAVSAGLPIKVTNTYWEVIYKTQKQKQPFVDPPVGVREMMLLQPLTRQVLFQRFNYDLPFYGKINRNATFQTSEITHMGIVVRDDSKEILRFYEDVLGLLRVRDDVETSYESSEAGRVFFDLKPSEKFIVTAFDDPSSSISDFQAARSGRLYIVRFPESIDLENRLSQAQPGCLGLSLYTYKVHKLETFFNRVQASNAKKVTEIVPNEFGETSFSFVAPDGYFWTLVSN